MNASYRTIVTWPRATAAARLLLAFAVATSLVGAVAPRARGQSGAIHLRGVVRDEDGSPVKRAFVSLSETGENLANRFLATRDDGSYDVELPAGV